MSVDIFNAAFSGNLKYVQSWIKDGCDVNSTDIKGDSILHKAAEGGHVDVVNVLIETGANVNSKDKNLDCPLHEASGNGHTGIVKTLIHNGADVNVSNRFYNSPLHKASEGGHCDVANALLLAGAKVIDERKYHKTPLHHAVIGGHDDIVETLLKAGADTNTSDETESSPLHYAAKAGNTNIAEKLVKFGAKADHWDISHTTPLHFAAQGGYNDMVLSLTQTQADINVTATNQETPLHCAAGSGHSEVVATLIRAGADVNVNSNGVTPLLKATEIGDLGMVKDLIQAGAIVNQTVPNTMSPLHWASGKGYTDILKLLIQCGADVNARDKYQQCPIHLTTQGRKIEILKILQEAGANLNALDHKDKTPLHYAANKGDIETAQTLIRAGCDVNINDTNKKTPLHHAAEKGHPDIVRILIQTGAELEVRDEHENAPLHLAAKYGHTAVFRILLDAGADVKTSAEVYPFSMHLAATGGHEGIIEILINIGIDVNIQDENMATPLHCATVKGRLTLIKLLLGAGGSVNARNRRQQTPLHQSATVGYSDLVKTLIEAGAEMNAQDDSHSSPLHLAARTDNAGVVRTLLRSGADTNIQNRFGKTAKQLGFSRVREVFQEFEHANKKVPKEIRVLGQRATAKYLAALEEDSVVSNVIRVMLVGHFGVGKTTIAMNLLQRDMKRIDSTDGIELYINQCIYNKEEDKWHTHVKYQDTFLGIDDIIRLDLADFAGQLIYYTTHQTYLTSRGLYLLVFNLAIGLDKAVEDEDLYPDRKQRRVIDFLEYWITTIVTYAKGEQVNFPKIILIGTHKDQIKDEAQLKMIKEEIKGHFREMVETTQLVVKDDLFMSATDMGDETRTSLRKTILEEGMKYKEFGERIPKSWIALQEKLTSLKRDHQFIVPKELVDRVNKEMDCPLDEEELDIFLRYLHNIGLILYFSTPLLNEYVILDPKIVIDAMKSFITCERFVMNPTKKKIWKRIKETGVVKRSNILKMWKGKVLPEYNEHLLAIMKRLFLICEPMIYKRGRTLSLDSFVVPSMINAVKQDIAEFSVADEARIVTTFSSEKLLPPAIFNRLVCSCLALWPLFHKHFYNGLVVLKSGRFHLIEIKRQVKQITTTIVHIEKAQRPDLQLCLAIKQFLVETLDEIVAVYSTSVDGPITCDSTSLDAILRQQHADIGLSREKDGSSCQCNAFSNTKLEDVILMRIAVHLQRTDLSFICSALLADAELAYEIENNYSAFNTSVKVFYVLQQWKEQSKDCSVSELRGLFEKYLDNVNKHIICQAMAEEIINPDGIDHTILVSKVYPEFLDAVADKLSYRYLHLGLELGLSLEEMERFKMENKRIVEISRAMLTKWYDDHTEDATVLNLARAFYRCGVKNLVQIVSEFKLEAVMRSDDTCKLESVKRSRCRTS